MKTLQNRPVSTILAVGLFASAPGCALPTPETTAPQRGSGAVVEPALAARVSSSPVSPVGKENLRFVGRAAPRSPQDPPPNRPSTKDECDACQGLWAAHGVEPVETCICKTNDEGRACIDGSECQGECLLDGDPEFHVMEPGDPPRGYYQGSCAGYDTTFGCFRHLPTDIQMQLPLTADDAGETICVD